ncbi:hypothetical protein MGN70_002122 [Eutypa lata]|uniref:Uncharacterized protein n=1 Tax=Eutypa lata (strain UCR-EL1) TaxID=1287681 RepID=M7SHC4_EUTLA|nr:hypothetical protein UCREL1_9403 [Eutypa lata UCREL1]KAI1255963.1 hypothetical protein MGN70_002122 [Eutypa lata]
MISYRMVAVAGFLASVGAVPLNINLGAYSPALVVGDGEISFGGGSDVTELMNTLEGAAVDAAAGTTSQARETQSVDVADAGNEVNVAAVDVDDADAASDAEEDAEPSVTVDPNLSEQAAQISALQGIAKEKEIEPRDPMITEGPKVKRDLAGFDRALLYAEAALTKGPVIQLGTGEGGSGVGIIVDNTGGQIGEGAEAVEEVGAAEKRDVESQPARRAKVTTMYIRRGVPGDLANRLRARDVESVPAVKLPSIKRNRIKRDSSEAIDAINLNIEDDQGFTMTLVESSDDEEEDAA